MRFIYWDQFSAILLIGILALGGAPALAQSSADGDALPCANLEPAVPSITDCMIDVNGFVLWFDYEGEETPTRVTVTQTDRSGEQLSEVEKHDIRDSSWPPSAGDITGDGRADVLLALFSEAGNTTFKVYQPDAEGTFFASGEVEAASPDSIRAADGLMIATTGGDAGFSYETGFLSDDWHGFETVYRLEVDAAEQTCRLVDSSGLEDRGLSADDIVADCIARRF